RYNRDDVVLETTKSGHLLRLHVPGLAEKRPSLLLGDSVYISLATDTGTISRRKYQGIVHQVEQSSVLLAFHPSFHSIYKGQKCHIEFSFSRTTLRREHHSISFFGELED